MGNKNAKSNNGGPLVESGSNNGGKEPSKLSVTMREMMPQNKEEWGSIAKPVLLYGGIALAGGIAFGLFTGVSNMKGRREYHRQAETLGFRTLTGNPAITEASYQIRNQMSSIIEMYKAYATSKAKGFANRRQASEEARDECKWLSYYDEVMVAHCDYVVGLGDIARAFKDRHKNPEAMAKLRSLIQVHKPPGVDADKVSTASALPNICEDSIINVDRSIRLVLAKVEETVPAGLYTDESPIYSNFAAAGNRLLTELRNVKHNLMRDVNEATRAKAR